MLYLQPRYAEKFYCAGESCHVPCAAPADMTWTRTLGDLSESGLSMACPRAAALILLDPAGIRFSQTKSNEPSVPPESLDRDQLALLLDARKTMDIVLQNRSLPLRTDVVLALTYGSEFEPMITTDARYAYAELDWGYTEQPYRQLTGVTQLQGNWDLKRGDLLHILAFLRDLCREDSLLSDHLGQTLRLFESMTGDQYRLCRDRFDEFLRPREYLFENLMVYLNHRHFLAHAEERTTAPGIKFSMVAFAAIRAMAFRLYRETGGLADGAFTALCRAFSRCLEESPCHRALLSAIRTEDLYSWQRLQRLLWQ